MLCLRLNISLLIMHLKLCHPKSPTSTSQSFQIFIAENNTVKENVEKFFKQQKNSLSKMDPLEINFISKNLVLRDDYLTVSDARDDVKEQNADLEKQTLSLQKDNALLQAKWERERRNLAEKSKELSDALNNNLSLTKDCEKIRADLEAERDKIVKLQNLIDKQKSEIKSEKKEKSELKRKYEEENKRLNFSVTKLQEEKDHLSFEIQESMKAREDIQAQQEYIDKLEDEINVINSKCAYQKNLIDGLDAENTMLRENIEASRVVSRIEMGRYASERDFVAATKPGRENLDVETLDLLRSSLQETESELGELYESMNEIKAWLGLSMEASIEDIEVSIKRLKDDKENIKTRLKKLYQEKTRLESELKKLREGIEELRRAKLEYDNLKKLMGLSIHATEAEVNNKISQLSEQEQNEPIAKKFRADTRIIREKFVKHQLRHNQRNMRASQANKTFTKLPELPQGETAKQLNRKYCVLCRSFISTKHAGLCRIHYDGLVLLDGVWSCCKQPKMHPGCLYLGHFFIDVTGSSLKLTNGEVSFYLKSNK